MNKILGRLLCTVLAVTPIFSITSCGRSNPESDTIVDSYFGKKGDDDKDCLYSKNRSFVANHPYKLIFDFQRWTGLTDNTNLYISFWVWDYNAIDEEKYLLPTPIADDHHVYWDGAEKETLNEVSLPTKTSPGFSTTISNVLLVRGGSLLNNQSSISFTFEINKNIGNGYVGCWFEDPQNI